MRNNEMSDRMVVSPTTHINELPAEVLSLIFTTVVGGSLYARSIGDKSYGLVECPTVLASVCTHWRRVAIGNPNLWSYINFTRNARNSGNLDHATLYVERSQDSPLYVHLGKFFDQSDDERRLMSAAQVLSQDIQSLLRNIAPRLKSFALNFTHSQDVTDGLSILFLQDAEYTISELALRRERLSLSGPRQERLILEDRWSERVRFLNALYFSRLPISPIFLSCRSLVELHITSPNRIPTTCGTIKQLLINNPNLRTIRISGMSLLDHYSSAGAEEINLPVLRCLDLSDVHYQFVKWLLPLLGLGRHELELYLDCAGMEYIKDESLTDILAAFFQRTPVKSLHISGRWILLPPILLHLPHLQRLGLTVYDFDRGTLDGIESLMPTLVNLRTIEMNECNLQDYSVLDQGLKTLLTLPSVRQIKHFQCGDALARGARERFRQLLSEDQDITAQVIEAPELAYETRPSPLR